MIRINKEQYTSILSARQQIERLGWGVDSLESLCEKTDLVLVFNPNNFSYYMLECNGDDREAVIARIESDETHTHYETDFLIDFHKWQKEGTIRVYAAKTIGPWTYHYDGVEGITCIDTTGKVARCHKSEFGKFYKEYILPVQLNSKKRHDKKDTQKKGGAGAQIGEEFAIAKTLGIGVEMLVLYILRKL